MPIVPSTMSVAGTAAALALFLFPAMGNGADDAGTSMFLLSGFGTLGVVHSSDHQSDFTGSVFQSNGAGFSHNWSSNVDSLLAGQVTANITTRLSAIVQIISEQNYDNTYRPHIEWADVKYQFTDEFSIRAGRTVLPSFLESDDRKVGYAYAWVRPPVEVYTLVPITDSDGVDASYQVQMGGGITQTLVASYGTAMPNNPRGSSNEKRLWNVADTLEYGPATLHISYQQAHLTVEVVDALLDAFRQFGPSGYTIANRNNQDDKLVTSASIGGAYDPRQWFIMGEWGSTNFHSALGKNTAWYVSGGYRVGKFTPYVTYAEAKTNALSTPGLIVSTLPNDLVAPATALNAALNSLLASKDAQNTVSLGGRWDFMKNVDLKLQFDHTRINAGSSGELTDLQPTFKLGTKVDLFSATVDFVF